MGCPVTDPEEVLDLVHTVQYTMYNVLMYNVQYIQCTYWRRSCTDNLCYALLLHNTNFPQLLTLCSFIILTFLSYGHYLQPLSTVSEHCLTRVWALCLRETIVKSTESGTCTSVTYVPYTSVTYVPSTSVTYVRMWLRMWWNVILILL